MTMSMKGNGMSDGDKDGELRRTGRHGRTGRAGLLGVAGRITKSTQVSDFDHPAQFRKPGKFWMKLVGVLTAAALGLTYAGSALADDFTADASPSAPDSKGDVVASNNVEVKDANDFKNALDKCSANAGTALTITVAGDLALTDNEVTNSNRDVYCDLTIVSGGGTDYDYMVTWSGDGSMLWPGKKDGSQTTGSLTVGSLTEPGKNALTFTAPSKGAVSGPLFHPQKGATLTINGGTYTGLTSKSVNVVYNDAKTAINGGTFEDNTNVTGVVYQRWDTSSLIVSGGVFKDNAQVPAGNQAREDAAKSCADITDYANKDACQGSLENAGGGAIHTNAGALTIQGDVKFIGNSTRAWGWMSGGGAVYAKGTLRIRNIVQGDTVKTPLFDRNWAADKNPWNSDGTRGKLSRGGAGGAVFLQSGSKAYLMGGTFTDNTSGYLGGGIYTEEGTTSWVARSLATGNTAGHFGGGLWFCPSGSSQASEGGNIALYSNTVDASIDGNTDNAPDNAKAHSADTTMAGDDFAIMNPAFKNHANTQFQLMDTWFTDRANPAVSWQWDNQPLRMSGGYLDGWLPNTDSRRGISAVLATTKTKETVTKGILKLTADGTDGDHVYTTGVALKAVDVDPNQVKQAESSAQVKITGNWSRLSGGGFGSNGVVLFSSPYSASWSKVAETTDGKPDKDRLLPGAVWTLSIKDDDISTPNTGGEAKTPYMDEYLRTQACQPGNVTGGESHCWEHDTKKGVWTAVIRDDGALDNNKTAGVVGVDNLAPGKYTLTEKIPPTGYELSETVYTFAITEPDDNTNTIPEEPTIQTDGNDVAGNLIGNKPLNGSISWSKTSSVNNAHLAGSEWQLADADGTPIKDYGNITDCVAKTSTTAAGQPPCTGTKDMDPNEGVFRLDNMANGTYKLTETNTPDGYWKPADGEYWQVVLKDGNATWTHHPATGGEETMNSGDIVNTAMQVSWTKADSNDTDIKNPLAGSKWTLTPKTETGTTQSTANVTDCTGSNCTNVKVTPGTYKDIDPDAGRFTIVGLTAGTYTLKEFKAPEGYDKSEQQYTFTVGATQPAVAIAIDNATRKNNTNVITNSKTPISQLPFTGGRSGLDWFIIGGGLALAAAAAGLVTGKARRREEL